MQRDSDWQKFLIRWLMISFVLHGIGVIFSQGFYHSDEHFQILEFLNAKLGLSAASDLPIEYQEKMRPWLQPAIFYAVTKGLQAIGVQDPFSWSFVFRALSSLLGWASLAALTIVSPIWIRDIVWRKRLVILSALLWYFPAFHARHSSENWGGAAFLIGVCALAASLARRETVPRRRQAISAWSALGVGIAFGAAFEFRYQVGVMIAGALLWLLVFGRLAWRSWIPITLGMTSVIALGTALDAWGYGHWVLAPWNYVDFNLIRGMVSSVDTDPWWDFYRRATTETWPLLGTLLLIAIPLAWILHPKHPLTWSHAPLFLIHGIIGHKELRFLFPMLHAAPAFIVLCFLKRDGGARAFPAPWPRIARPIGKFLMGWNLIALVVLTLMPAWMPIRFQDFLYHWRKQELREGRDAPIEILYVSKNPYVILGIPMNFYRAPSVHFRQIGSYGELKSHHEPYWLFYDGFVLQGDAEFLAPRCQAVFKSLPHWIEAGVNGIGAGRWMRHVTNWSLYQCQ